MPTPEQIPLFIIMSLFESVAFGIGMAFIIFNWKNAGKFSDNRNLSNLTFISIA